MRSVRKFIALTSVGAIVALLGVLCSLAVTVGPAKAGQMIVQTISGSNSVPRVDCRFGGGHDWSHLGGDPVWPGGIGSVSQLSVVVHSAAGQRSLICNGLNQAERQAVTAHVGSAKACAMPFGTKFISMTFHSDGASVDRPTTFDDPRFRNHPALAFCLTLKVKEGKTVVTIKLVWPERCVNAALLELNRSTPSTSHPAKPTTTSTCSQKSGNGSVNVCGNGNTCVGINVCNTTTTQCGCTTTTPTTTVVTTTTTPTTTTTQTVTTPSPQIRLEQIQELYPNETQPVCADVKNMPSGGGKVNFSVSAGSAPKGTFTDGSESASAGNSRVCDTFQAPNATGTNQITVDLLVNGTKADSDSLGVEIIPQPSNP